MVNICIESSFIQNSFMIIYLKEFECLKLFVNRGTFISEKIALQFFIYIYIFFGTEKVIHQYVILLICLISDSYEFIISIKPLKDVQSPKS